MAEKWCSLPPEKKEEYRRKAEEIQEHPMESLTQKQKRDIIIRMARRHQSDVCDAILLLNVVYITLTPLGKYSGSVGFQFCFYVLY